MGFLILLMLSVGSKRTVVDLQLAILDCRLTIVDPLLLAIRVLLWLDDWQLTGYLCCSPHNQFWFTIDFRLLVYEIQLWILDFGLWIVDLRFTIVDWLFQIVTRQSKILNRIIVNGLAWALVALVGWQLRRTNYQFVL